MIRTHTLLAIVLGLTIGTTVERAAAVTFNFESIEPGAYQMFQGTFDAFDLNADTRITSDEVTSFSAMALGGSIGGPGGWQVIVTPAAETFFNIAYDLDGLIGDSGSEFLEFGYRRKIACSDYAGGPADQVRTLVGEASLSHVTLPGGIFSYGTCPSGKGATRAFPSIRAAVTSESLIATTPLPVGAFLLATALGLIGMRGRKSRN